MKAIALSITLLIAAVPALSEEPLTPQPSGARACETNFTEAGSFFKGKTYRTWQEHQGLVFDGVFRKVAQTVAENNWGTVNANKDLGIITASQAVTMGQGAVAPLNVIVKEKADGVIRVEANFSTAGGQTAAKKAVMTELCKLVEAPSQ